MTKLEAFTQYMRQFASHRGADMKWVMEASSHGRIFSYAWDEATKAEREACAKVCEEVIRDCGWQSQIKDAAEFLAYEIRCRDENELEQGGRND